MVLAKLRSVRIPSSAKKCKRRLRALFLNRLGVKGALAQSDDSLATRNDLDMGALKKKVSESGSRKKLACDDAPKLSTFSPTNMPRSTMQPARAGQAPPKMQTPPPLPSRWASPPCPTAYPRLPHASISLSYSATLRKSTPWESGTVGRLMLPRVDSFVGVDSNPSPTVCFAYNVIIMEIPSHLHYWKSTRDAMWHSRSAMKWMVYRNHLEMKADGGKFAWRNFTEEDGMKPFKNKLLHPATYERLQLELARRKRQAEQLADEESSTRLWRIVFPSPCHCTMSKSEVVTVDGEKRRREPRRNSSTT
jgi:hypothetical protein